jgi:hypothetical protein
MAETREQINPKVTPATKARLLTYCQEKHTTQSDVTEAALLAFLQPKEGDDLLMVMAQLLHGIAAKQEALEQGVVLLVPLLETITEQLEGLQAAPPVPVARYEQMYPQLRPAPVPAVVEEAPTVEEPPVPQRRILGFMFPWQARP